MSNYTALKGIVCFFCSENFTALPIAPVSSLARLNEWFNEDNVFHAEVLRIFTEDAPHYLYHLETAFEQRNWADFNFATHKLTGLLAFFDIHKAIVILRSFEVSYEKDGSVNYDLEKPKVRALREIIEKAITEINAPN